MEKVRIIRKEHIESIALVTTHGKEEQIGLMFETTKGVKPIVENKFVIEVDIDDLSLLLAYILKEEVIKTGVMLGAFKSAGKA
jgi:hypothetical protein